MGRGYLVWNFFVAAAFHLKPLEPSCFHQIKAVSCIDVSTRNLARRRASTSRQRKSSLLRDDEAVQLHVLARKAVVEPYADF